MIYRKFIATILAASIAITGFTAAPARADSDDYVKVIAGIAALAVIGSVIADKDDDHKVSRKYYNTHNYYGKPHYKKKHKKKYKKKHKHYSKKHKKSHYGHGYKKSRGGHDAYAYRK